MEKRYFKKGDQIMNHGKEQHKPKAPEPQEQIKIAPCCTGSP
jgi:hypothetical protein